MFISLIFMSFFAFSNECNLILGPSLVTTSKLLKSLEPSAEYDSAEDEVEYLALLESLAEDEKHFLANDLGLSNIDAFEPYENRPFFRDVFFIAKLKAGMVRVLSPKEERVVRMRFFLNMELDKVAKDLRLSRERIRQIELNALIKLKRYLHTSIRDWERNI
jgi:DNA-directed RNA polymerase specialized sigma subunit